jgi:hypothetical protein
MRTSFKRAAACTAAAFAFLALPAQALPIVNGGFEDGLANWTVVNQPGSEGSFRRQSGGTSPATGTAVPAPPGGRNAAMTDAGAGGSHVLYQDFMQATSATRAMLSFDLFIGNRADAFHVPAVPTLDWATAVLNQQARADILVGGSDPFSMAAQDLLLNLFATGLTDPLVSGYNRVEVDITDLLNANLGTSLRLRFAEVDNVAMFQFGVDNVVLAIGDPAEVPEPGSILLILAGLAAAGVASRRSSHLRR